MKKIALFLSGLITASTQTFTTGAIAFQKNDDRQTVYIFDEKIRKNPDHCTSVGIGLWMYSYDVEGNLSMNPIKKLCLTDSML